MPCCRKDHYCDRNAALCPRFSAKGDANKVCLREPSTAPTPLPAVIRIMSCTECDAWGPDRSIGVPINSRGPQPTMMLRLRPLTNSTATSLLQIIGK